jgi:energy-coupling factor transport system permease protein
MSTTDAAEATSAAAPRRTPAGVPAPRRLPRALHPGAWWLWALGMAAAATRTTNPLLLMLILAVVGFVVSARRGDAPWARGFRHYLLLALFVVVLRVVFRMLLDGQSGTHVLFTLPQVTLPDAAAGVRLGGPVALEGVLAAFADGLRLATLLVCLGAANVLANPKRLLRSVPSALFELGVAVTVALSVAPQLVESAMRVNRARRLRAEAGRRVRVVRQVLLPVMTDALDRSIHLAAAMDARGYGRTGSAPRGDRRVTAVLVLGGLLGVCVGTYGLLDGSTPALLGAPTLLVGISLAAAGFALGGRRVRRTRYRPDPWRWPEWGVVASGLLVAVGLVAVPADALHPGVQPLRWPPLPPVAVIVLAFGLLPAWVAPPVPRGGRS